MELGLVSLNSGEQLLTYILHCFQARMFKAKDELYHNSGKFDGIEVIHEPQLVVHIRDNFSI